MIETARDLEAHLQSQLGKVVFGLDGVIHALTITLIARGHVLLQAPPGLGKTLLSKAFSTVLGGKLKRIQGTADLMPSDISGVHIFNAQNQSFEFQPGPLFADVVLVDEINRAGPKTQSALLEAMEERQVSVDRETFELPEDFLVVATQNPKEFEGTFPLPESQLDRFTLCVDVPYISRAHEAKVLSTLSAPAADQLASPDLEEIPRGTLARLREGMNKVYLSPELVEYMLDIAESTRNSSSVSLGLSTRGVLALARCARIEASLRGGDFVIPDDVKQVAPWVIEHRLVLTAEAAINGIEPATIMSRLLDSVAVPR